MKQDHSLRLLFNIEVEEVFQKWNSRLGNSDWYIDNERLFNIWYADDILLSNTKLDEVIFMMEILDEVGVDLGWRTHISKTKILI